MRILLGGRVSRGEFHEIERDVNGIAYRAQAQVVTRERLNVHSFFDRFIDESFEGPEPTLHSLFDVDVFLLCRSFPNEFSVRDVEAIRRVAPLAPIVMIAGELCEGENRTGESFPGVRRYYLGSWRAEGRRELERFFSNSGSTGVFADTPLASTVDQLVAEIAEPCRASEPASGEAMILADDPSMAAFLNEAFQTTGYSPRVESLARFDSELEREGNFARVVVDVVDLSDPNFPYKLAAIKSAFPGVPIDLLAFAPRCFERQFYERRDLWGRVRVVAKPFNVDDLTNGAR